MTGDLEKILLVDDEQDIRDVLSIALMDLGFDVITAGNGQEALVLFRQVAPAVVLTDIKMPEMDGIALLRKIKNENPDTEVVMITGHGDTDLAIRSLKYEAVDFITKPINEDTLEIALKRVREKITARQQLKKYTEKLEALLREKLALQGHLSSLGIMIGSISHSIKGLLTRLDGGLYLVASAYSEKKYDEIGEGLEILEQTTERIKKMIKDVLYYAKEREPNVKPISVSDFAGDLVSTVAQKVGGRDIELVSNVNTGDAVFEIDAELMNSALINIFDNAVEACQADESKPAHKIILNVRKEKNHIILDIYDDGSGMDGETKEKIFDLFFSLKGHGGTGFGLFITATIIKQHRGEIHVVSEENKGTWFNIKIPVHHQRENN